MPSYVTPKKNTEYIFYISLVSQSNTKIFQVNPTLAAGDVKVSTDGGAEANITTLPVVTPAGSKRIKVTLSTTEMNGDNIQVTFSDAAGAEWCDITINIQTTATQIDGSFRDLMTLIERVRAGHTFQGDIFYFDPVNGNDSTGDGSFDNPYATITKCLTVVISGHHDIIAFKATDGAASPVVLDEQITISKNYVFILATGEDSLLETTSIGDLITIDADGVEIEGFKLRTATTGDGNCITVNAGKSFCRIANNKFLRSRGDGISIEDGVRCIIEDNFFDNVGTGGASKAVRIKGTGSGPAEQNIIRNNIVRNTTGDAFYIEGGANCVDNVIENNIAFGSSGWGIQILVDVVNTLVRRNAFFSNTSGNINDLATAGGTINNTQWAKDSVCTETRLAELDAANIPADIDAIIANLLTIVSDIWNEVLTKATYNIANSAGKRLRQLSDIASVEGLVNDAGATTTVFITDLIKSTSSFYSDQLLIFNTGNLAGQSGVVLNYDGSTKTVTLSEPLTEAPADGDEFVLLAYHIHPVTQIADAVWDTLLATMATASSIGKKLADWVLGSDNKVEVSSDTHVSGQTIAGISGTKNTLDDLNDITEVDVDTELTSNHGAGSWGAGGTVVLPVMQGEVYSAVAVQDKDVKIVRGDTPRIIFDLEEDYTGWTVWFAAKEQLSDTAYAIALREVVWSDASLGQGYIDLSASDTDILGKFFAEIEIRQGAQRLTAMKYKLVIIDDVIDT